MAAVEPTYPLLGADNHLYETEDSLTRYLPKQYQDTIQYVQVNGALQHLGEADQAKIMGGSLARLMAV